MYVVVKEDSETRLHLVRGPTIISWALLTGFSVVGFGLACYGSDPMFWKVLYGILGLVVGVSCIDDWEDCEFNKKTKEIRWQKVSVWDWFFALFSKRADAIVASLSDLDDAVVVEERVNYFGTSYQVVLKFRNGMSIGITEVSTFGSKTREHYEIADKIRKYVNLEDDNGTGNDYLETGSSSSSEDLTNDFECIDKADIVDEQQVAAFVEPSPTTAVEGAAPSTRHLL